MKMSQNVSSIENINVDRKKKRNKKKGPKTSANSINIIKLDSENVLSNSTQTQFRESQKRPTIYYKAYLSEDKVLQGLENGELIKGTLRISQRNSQESYIDNTSGDGYPDYLILGVRDRNRALNGDIVVVKPKGRDNWVLRTSVFRNWKQQNNIGNDFEMSLNNELYDNVSIGTASDVDEDANENDLTDLMDGTNGDDLNLHKESFVCERGDYLSDIDDNSVVWSTEEEEESEAIFRVALEKLHELRVTEKKTDKRPVQVFSYNRKQILRYRKRVPLNYCPRVTDEVKGIIMKNVVQKNKKYFPFQFVGNFNRNNEIPESLLIRTCEVVYISEKKLYGSSPFTDCAASGRARASGHLVPMNEEVLTIYTDHFHRNNMHCKPGKERPPPAIFLPTDTRLPKMMISHDQLPADFTKRPQDFASFIFVAEMYEDWSPETSLAKGKLLSRLGEFGDVKAETKSLLFTNNIDTRPFPKEVLEELEEFFPSLKKNSTTKKTRKKSVNEPNVDDEAYFLERCKSSTFKINRKILESRKDFRFYTIFTIDPASARDLDDALHVKRSATNDGVECWEVGVHIADVSYFVPPGGKVDMWARRRGTSVYLVDEVIPMLPRPLCEGLCSLNPNEDRLTFSVVWKMDDEGNILDEWFGRSVIRSCVKLAYEHAQDFIDHPEKELSLDELPPIYLTNRRVAVAEDIEEAQKRMTSIRDSVLQLNKIASVLRRKRFNGGALRLDAPKLKIKFSDEGRKFPCGVCMDERSDANFLVEEFMLLANMAVAKRISSEYPDVALLRRHPAPKTSAFDDAVAKCDRIGFPLGSAASSKAISDALREYESKPELRRTVLPILFQYLLRSMQLAIYFCCGTAKSSDDFRHFALNVDRYTHFTSPIRRYPDLMVHRLLSACLGYRKKPTYTPEQVEAIAKHCNTTKATAKAVSDGSAEIFFNAFVRETGRFETFGIVTMVMESSVEVILLEFGMVERISMHKIKGLISSKFEKADAKDKGKSGTLRVVLETKKKSDGNGASSMKDFDNKEEKIMKKEIDEKKQSKNGGEGNKNMEESENSEDETVEKTEEDAGHNSCDMDKNNNSDVASSVSTTEMVIKMLSIVKVALVPDQKPGKHNATLVINPNTANLTFNDLENVTKLL